MGHTLKCSENKFYLEITIFNFRLFSNRLFDKNSFFFGDFSIFILMKITWIGVFSFSGLQTAGVQIKTEWWSLTWTKLKMWTYLSWVGEVFCGHEFIQMSEFFSLSILVFVKGLQTEQSWPDNPARWLVGFWEQHHLEILTRAGQAKKSHTI